MEGKWGFFSKVGDIVVVKNNLLDLVFAPSASYVLFAANRLKVFTQLAEKERTSDEIAASLNAQKYFVEGLLDACVAMGLLRRQGHLYSNSEMSDAYLVEGRPQYLGALIEVQSIEIAQWERLYDRIIGGRPGEGAQLEKEITAALFTKAMNNLGMMGEADALASAVDLSQCQTLVDVGCGSGIYSISLCRRFPEIHALLLDREEVLQTTRQFIEKSHLEGRISMRAIDITKESFGNDMDVVLLSDVLYQDRKTCEKILQSAYDALRPNGRLVIRGYYADPEGSQPLFGSMFALAQLLWDDGRELISVKLLQGWIKQVGFKILKTHSLTERSTYLIAEKCYHKKEHTT